MSSYTDAQIQTEHRYRPLSLLKLNSVVFLLGQLVSCLELKSRCDWHSIQKLRKQWLMKPRRKRHQRWPRYWNRHKAAKAFSSVISACMGIYERTSLKINRTYAPGLLGGRAPNWSLSPLPQLFADTFWTILGLNRHHRVTPRNSHDDKRSCWIWATTSLYLNLFPVSRTRSDTCGPSTLESYFLLAHWV